MPRAGSRGHGSHGDDGGLGCGGGGSARPPRGRRRTPCQAVDAEASAAAAAAVVAREPERHAVRRLPAAERALYLLVAVAGHAYAFNAVHLASREHEEELHAEFELEKGFCVWGFKKDPTDFEWTFWSHWASSRLLWMLLGHVLLSQLFSRSAPQLRPWGWLAYGVACCVALLGAWGTALVLAHALASYAAARRRRPALCWLTSLGLLAGLQATHWSHTQSWYESENEYFLLLFTLAMTNLRCTSFSLELCRQPEPPACPPVPLSPCHPAPGQRATGPQTAGTTARPTAAPSLFWPLVYTFYYPPLHNGPIMSYCDFVARCEQPASEPDKVQSGGPQLPRLAVRVAAWWALAELMLHLGYFSALHQHEELLASLPSATLACLAIAHVSFFYVKYLVLFGVPSVAMQLDGVRPPPLPRCVSVTHGFSDMWRNFDVGLHRWLLRYVYVPLGGSQGGALRRAVSCGAVFLYVFFWHGARPYLLLWAVLNWLGVTVETGLGRALSSASAKRLSLGGRLSPLTQRRLLGVIAGASTAMVILSNLVFLGGTAVGAVYWDRVFLQGWPWTTLGVLAFLYCCAQFGMDWDQAKVP